MTEIRIEPLTAHAFALFGDVIEITADGPTKIINEGKCGRFHDLANLELIDGQPGISLFHGQPYQLPIELKMMERHPLGSQAFIPMSADPFLVIVAEDASGPCDIRAFMTNGTQGVNYHRNVWHGVLTPLEDNRLFAVIDRIGDGENLEEYWFETPHIVRH